MKFENFAGIDISKEVLDLVIFRNEGETIYVQCRNEEADISNCFSSLFEKNNLSKDKTVFCAEHTGHYGNKLIRVALDMDIFLWHESPLKIAKSQGLVRGKNDKIDASRIAEYAKRYIDLAKPIVAVSHTIEKLKSLATERDLLMKDKGKYEGQLKQEAGFLDQEYLKGKTKRIKKVISILEQAIKEIEKQMDIAIESDPSIKQSFEVIVSIPGIGKQTAIATIVATDNFSRFTDSRKFICHAGCAPFKYFSGKSIRSANRVSHKANKQLKRLFHMAALSCIQIKGDIREYYLRKVAEGKNKMSVINAVRAKLISRIFSVVREGRKYENFYSNSLV